MLTRKPLSVCGVPVDVAEALAFATACVVAGSPIRVVGGVLCMGWAAHARPDVYEQWVSALAEEAKEAFPVLVGALGWATPLQRERVSGQWVTELTCEEWEEGTPS